MDFAHVPRGKGVTLADVLRTASMDYDEYKMRNVTAILQAVGA